MKAFVLILTLYGESFQLDGPFTKEDCLFAQSLGVDAITIGDASSRATIALSGIPYSLTCESAGQWL